MKYPSSILPELYVLPQKQIKILTSHFLNHPFQHKYFISGTWEVEDPSKFYSYHNGHAVNVVTMLKEIEEENKSQIAQLKQFKKWQIRQIQRYFIILAQRCSAHLIPYFGIRSLDHTVHFHAALLADKELSLKKMERLWIFGHQRSFQEYDINLPGIQYIFKKHEPVPLLKGAFHPNRCKKNCSTYPTIKKEVVLEVSKTISFPLWTI